MANNSIQFRHGMSLPEFLKSCGIEETCVQALRVARWLKRFACPRCGCRPHCELGGPVRHRFQCNASCNHQTSLTASTLFARTKLPLTTWFLAIYLLSKAKIGCLPWRSNFSSSFQNGGQIACVL
jgi:hypothetical protein